MDGGVIGWGDNSWGQLDVPETLEPAISIDGGSRYTIARTTRGTLVAWGAPRSYVFGYPGGPIRHFDATAPGDDRYIALAVGPDALLGTRDLCPPCTPADLDGNGMVDHLDLIALFDVLGRPCRRSEPMACDADLNHDGAVGLDDLSELFMNWGPCP